MTDYEITGTYNLSRNIKILQGQKKKKLEPVRLPVLAKVFDISGSHEVANKPGYVWIHEYGSDESPAQALAGNVSVQAGDWVTVIKDPKEPYQWRIVGYYTGNLDPGTYNLVINHLTGPHATNHQMPTELSSGTDPVLIFQPAMQMLKTTGDGATLTVSTQDYVYQMSGIRRHYGGSTTDLTASVPGAGLVRKVLIYLDENTNVLKIVNGSTVTYGGASPVPYPVLPTGGRPSAYIELYNGQTAITSGTHTEDARDFLSIGSGSGVSIPAPTAESQILMSDETLSWVAVFPVIDEDGNIVTSESKIVHGS